MSFIERIEQLQAQKRDISDDEKVVFAEAKAKGYTPRYMRALIKLRKKTPSERDEDDAMMELYLASVGMARETPLFRSVSGMGVDVAAREKVIEALKLLAPEDGEITVKAGGGPRMRLWRDKEGVHVEEVRDAPPAPPPSAEPQSEAKRPGKNAPDCTEDQAFELGRVARRNDEPVIANPFAWNDPCRRRWDEGWRDEDGGDGMGPK
ncbi:DUF2312 domain-containing protein [Roseovarius indicus]|uniref:DUF2312 domain-containing protein n=1 Tax=Roseovarius indicus TaxID=540747 RepID=UPI0007D8E277|nr:DUF2312 domain-containing protein [Roseovarius indicus]OAO02696.1 hypothetical protein A8B76_04975 [Roseovarius indicus]